MERLADNAKDKLRVLKSRCTRERKHHLQARTRAQRVRTKYEMASGQPASNKENRISANAAKTESLITEIHQRQGEIEAEAGMMEQTLSKVGEGGM